jgi:hypothetical protein
MVAFEMRDMLDETANWSLLPLRKAIIEPVVEADLYDPQPAEVLAN